VYPVAGGNAHFQVHVPYFGEGGFRGAVVGVYSLNELLSREIPWWFSERYRVSAVYADGQEIASKSKVAPLSPHLEYQIPFDPPGHGVNLHITAYRGETRWVPILLIASMVVLGGVIIWSLLQLRRHVSHRQAAEQALRDAMAFRKAMEDSLLTGLRARDLEGRVTYVNPAFCKMTGYAPDELLGRAPPMPYWDPEDLPSIEERQQQILAGTTPLTGVERRLIRKNGERFDALVFDAPLIDAEGRHTGWMGSVLDITEQKRMRELARQQEDRLQATARLVTMGEMASTLAHELNQPLAAISSYSAGCLNRLESDNADPGELKGIMVKLSKQAQRAGQIIKRVHDFVRRSEPKRELIDVNALIREAVALVEPNSRKHLVRIQADLAPGLPEVPADPVMIEQVVVNLLRNAMDAMAETPPARRLLSIATRVEGGQVLIRVADRGGGIPPEAAARLFQPFFTTKAEGMGMGLNICRSIAELHRGKLGFEANPGGGTIFTFSLPIESL
jgi:two-component system sensor histidine kinase DctS